MFPEYVSNIEEDQKNFCKKLNFLEEGEVGAPQNPYDTDLLYYAVQTYE